MTTTKNDNTGRSIEPRPTIGQLRDKEAIIIEGVLWTLNAKGRAALGDFAIVRAYPHGRAVEVWNDKQELVKSFKAGEEREAAALFMSLAVGFDELQARSRKRVLAALDEVAAEFGIAHGWKDEDLRGLFPSLDKHVATMAKRAGWQVAE